MRLPRRWWRLAAGTLVFLLAPAALALDPQRSVSQFASRSWGPAEGLPSLSVSSIAQTPEGYLWLGTAGGLARFDGHRFTVFDRGREPIFPMNEVRILRAEADGTLWLGFPVGGLVRARGVDFALLEADFRALSALPDGDCMLIGGNDGIRRVTGRVARRWPNRGLEGMAVDALARGANGTIWASGSRAGAGRLVAIVDGEVVLEMADARFGAVVARLRFDEASGELLAEAADGRTYAAPGGRPTRPDGVALRLVRDTPTPLSAYRDRHGVAWWGDGQALWRQIPGAAAERVTSAVSGSSVMAVLEDREGAIWVASWDGGLTQLLDGPLRTLGPVDGLPGLVRSVLVTTDGALWAGGEGGVARLPAERLGAGTGGRFSGHVVERWGITDGLPSPSVYSLAELPDGSVAVGTLRGLSLLQHGSARASAWTSRPEMVHALRVRPGGGGGLWIGYASGGVALAQGGVERVELPVLNPFALELDRQGRLLVGSRRGAWRRSAEGAYEPIRLGLPAERLLVFSIYQDRRDALWVGTLDAGVFRVAGDSVRRLGRADGLPDDSAVGFFEGSDGALWMATGRGLASFAASDLDAFLAGRATRLHPRLFGLASGLASAELHGGSGPVIALGRDGNPWFATAAGAAQLDLAAIPAADAPPLPLIEAVRVDGGPVAPSARLDLDSGRHRVELEYTAIHLRQADALRFRYRVVGLAEDWVESADRRTAEIPALGHGRYRFEVQASLDGDRWSPATAREVTVRPLLWETTWFRALSLAGIVLAGFALSRARVRSVLAREHSIQGELESLVELGRSLTGMLDPEVLAGRFLEALVTRFPRASWHLLLVDRDGRGVLLRHSGAASGAVAAVRAGGQPPGEIEGLLAGLRSAGASAAVPIRSGEQGLGVVAVGPLADAAPFRPRDRAHLEGLAAQGAVAFEGAWQAQDAVRWRHTSEARQFWADLDLVERLAFAAVAREAAPIGTVDLVERLCALTEGAVLRPATVRAAIERLVAGGSLGRGTDGELTVERRSWLLLPELRRPLVEIARDSATRIGPYRLFERLGAGGMGEVFRAVDVHNGGAAAVKLLHGHVSADAAARRRFERESDVIAAIDHPNVVRRLAHGEHQGRLYFAMELLSGETLAERLQRGTLEPSVAWNLAMAMAAGLAAVHERGIVHRDVKPANIMCPRDGDFVLLDLGLARDLGSSTLTEAQAVLGTVPYMAPEAIRGEPLDPRADFWSLGVVLYEAIVGSLPWRDLPSVKLALEIVRATDGASAVGLDAAPDPWRPILGSLLAPKETRVASGPQLIERLRSCAS